MKLNFGKEFKSLKKLTENFFNTKEGYKIGKAIGDTEIAMGLSSDRTFGTLGTGAYTPVYVGDSSWKGSLNASAELKAIANNDLAKVNVNYRYNPSTKKFDGYASKYVADGALTNAQALSPWNVNIISQLYKQPLIYSNAKELVKIDSGSDPWAEVMTLYEAAYAGFGPIGQAGSPSNSMHYDINVQSGMMTSAIINMTASYALDIIEMERAKGGNNPFGAQMITEKQRYALYVLDLLEDYLIYYGNEGTETKGLLSVNSVSAWSGVGSSLTVINAGASTSKGSDIYALVYGVVNTFLTANYNKFNKIRIAVSPTAYNLLATVPYSATYNPKSVLTILEENFRAGIGAYNKPVDVKFIVEPLLSPSTIFNSLTTDYMIITAPEIETGAEETNQDIIVYGSPLNQFVYPVIPGMYETQYKMLKRTAGIFAPISSAIAAYSGFGV